MYFLPRPLKVGMVRLDAPYALLLVLIDESKSLTQSIFQIGRPPGVPTDKPVILVREIAPWRFPISPKNFKLF